MKKVIRFIFFVCCLVFILSVPAFAKNITLEQDKNIVCIKKNTKLNIDAGAKKHQLDNADYKWYLKKDEGLKLISSSRVLHKTFKKRGKYKILCKYTINEHSYKKYLTVYVENKEILITQQPENVKIRLGGIVSFEVLVKHDNAKIKYQWQYKTGNKKWKNIKGATSNDFSFVMNGEHSNFLYRCRIKQKGFKKCVYTNVVTAKLTGARKSLSEEHKKTLSGFILPKSLDGYMYVYCVDKQFTKQVKNAIQILNGFSGEFFVYAYDPSISDVVVTSYDILNSSAIGKGYYKDNSFSECMNNQEWIGVAFSDDILNLHYMVALNKNKCLYNPKMTTYVIIHELMHCIKIGHSKEDGSIMREYIEDGARLTQSDINILKQRIYTYRNIIRCLH